MDKKKISLIFALFISFCIFCFTYYYCNYELKSINTKNNKQEVKNYKETPDALYVQSRSYDTVSSNSKIIFKTKYNKCETFVVNKEQQAGLLAGKTKSELENIYAADGYKVDTISETEVVLIREVDKYEPNKYVLGIKDGYIAIYKTDKEGNMFIEDQDRDITDIKIDKLKAADIDLLTKGDKYFQCSSKEDAQAILEDYE